MEIIYHRPEADSGKSLYADKNLSKKLVELAAHSWVLLVLAGLIKASMYYGEFGIPIIAYLSVSEMLIYFLTDIYALIFILIQVYLYFDIYLEVHNKVKEKSSISLKKTIVLLLANGLGLILFLCLFFLGKIADYFSIPITFMISMFTLSIICGRLNPEKMKPFSPLRIYRLGSVLIILFILFLLARKDVHKLNMGKTSSVRLELKDAKKLDTSNDLRFLGKTGEYYFFYYMKKGKARIIPASEVEEIELY